MKADPIPKNYQQLAPYITVSNASAALEFYKKVFGAKERMCLREPNGRIGHAEVDIGSGLLMFSDPYEGHTPTPEKLGGTTLTLSLYVEDVDATIARAVEAGSKVVMPAKDQFYGDRSGRILDPFGHMWNIATHIEDVSPEEMNRRMAEWSKTGGCSENK